jgi:hypothetical protein
MWTCNNLSLVVAGSVIYIEMIIWWSMVAKDHTESSQTVISSTDFGLLTWFFSSLLPLRHKCAILTLLFQITVLYFDRSLQVENMLHLINRKSETAKAHDCHIIACLPSQRTAQGALKQDGHLRNDLSSGLCDMNQFHMPLLKNTTVERQRGAFVDT